MHPLCIAFYLYSKLHTHIQGALPLVQAENGTLDWYAIEFPDTNSFGIVDFFATEMARNDHLNGKVASALFASAPKLFTATPEITKFDVVAATLK